MADLRSRWFKNAETRDVVDFQGFGISSSAVYIVGDVRMKMNVHGLWHSQAVECGRR